MATQPDLCWPLRSCWPLSHLAVSPGALCQQMYRKHLFPTQGWLSRGWKLPLAMQELTLPCPALWDHPLEPSPHHSWPTRRGSGGTGIRIKVRETWEHPQPFPSREQRLQPEPQRRNRD